MLDDGVPPFVAVAGLVERKAGEAGLQVVLRARWRPEPAAIARDRRTCGALRADAVYLGGLLGSNGGELISALRALDPPPTLIAPESFGPVFALWDFSGGDARGMYLTITGRPTERLPAPGQRFLRELGRPSRASR